MNLFKRRLILGERIMFADGRGGINCVFTVKLRGEVTEGGLRAALNTVQAKHPLLQAKILWRKGRPYFLGDGRVGEIPVRVVDRVSEDDWERVTEVEWGMGFAMAEGPLARVVWVRGVGVSELMLVCPHCICDGVTGVTLMRELLLSLDQPGALVGEDLVFRSVKELVPRKLAEDRVGLLKAWGKSLFVRLFFSLRRVKPIEGYGTAYALRWRLDEEMSSGLLERCKSEGVTVHAMLCVTLLEAYRGVKKEQAKNKVICPVDIRRYVREIKKDMLFAFAPIVELGAPSGEAGASGEAGFSAEGGFSGGAGFWERCRQLKGELSEKMAKIKAYELLLHSEYYHPVAGKLIRWLCSDAGGHDLTFSNMGRLDIPETYGGFSVEAVYSPTVAFPWRNPNTVVVSSFRGQMDFAFVSNTGFLRQEEGEAIKAEVLRILETVMGAGEPGGVVISGGIAGLGGVAGAGVAATPVAAVKVDLE